MKTQSKSKQFFIASSLCAAAFATSGAQAATLISPSGIDVFVASTGALNNRGDQANAIDGDINTIGHLTPGFTAVAQIVALDLGASMTVGGIRVAKNGDTDGIAGQDNMDLQILFTTDIGALNTRTYVPVTGLANSISEPISADSILSATAEIDNDHHDFATEGFYTLDFDAVNVTAIAIRFDRDAGDPQNFVHYGTWEFQAVQVPEPSTSLLAVLSLGFFLRRRR